MEFHKTFIKSSVLLESSAVLNLI